MTYGPATPNTTIAQALDELAHRLTREGCTVLSQTDWELMREAADRIDELGDDEED